jgi:hypothetical protein
MRPSLRVYPTIHRKIKLKIVIIYGPPAAGKLTVARELAKKTGHKLLHGHQIADLLVSIIPFGTKGFLPLMEKVRLTLLETARKNRKVKGIILTCVYEPTGKVELREGFLRKVDRLAGGELHLVRLKCAERELYKRVRGMSRRQFRKIREKAPLQSLLRSYRFDAAVRFKESLAIDNTELSAVKCAEQIKKHYHL